MKRLTSSRSGSYSLVVRSGAVFGSSTIHIHNARHGAEIPCADVFFQAARERGRQRLRRVALSHVDAFEHQQQLSRFDHDVSVLAAPWDRVAPFLEAFDSQNLPVAIPVEHAHAVRSPGEKDKQRAGQRALTELRANQRRQPVDPFAAIHGSSRETRDCRSATSASLYSVRLQR